MSYYILDGREIQVTDDRDEWGRFFNDALKRRVALTVVGKKFEVSTVFLGVDYNFGWAGPPILFETMVFGGELDQNQWRYSTYEEAERGHARVVRAVRKLVKEKK